MAMTITNLTTTDIYFGPLHVPASGTLVVDDTSATSLYLLDDTVADAINNAYQTNQISVSGAADPFPRPTGEPKLLHGTGTPEGIVFAPQGSVYMRRDGGATNGGVVYTKTTGATFSTGWLDVASAAGLTQAAPPGCVLTYSAPTAPTGWLLCDGAPISRATYAVLFALIGTTYGAGDGSTTFNLPDLRGRVSVGYAASGGHSDVSELGNSELVSAATRRPKHRHTVNDPRPSPRQGLRRRILGRWPQLLLRRKPSRQRLEQHQGDRITIGAATGDALDAPAYLVLNHIIKT